MALNPCKLGFHLSIAASLDVGSREGHVRVVQVHRYDLGLIRQYKTKDEDQIKMNESPYKINK